jgi:hypothetical protein
MTDATTSRRLRLLRGLPPRAGARSTTLDGLAFGVTYGRPEPAIEAVTGALVTIDYETTAPLA